MLGLTGKRAMEIYVVRCKRCQRDVPAGVSAFPADNVVVSCCLCAERRRYRPTEVFLSRPHHLVKAEHWVEYLPHFN